MARPAPPGRADFAAFVALQTRWADCDAYGHLNNAAYLGLMDTAMSLWQLDQGIALTGDGAERFVVVESGCSYFRELAFPDRLEAGLRIPRIGGASYRIEIALFLEGAHEAASLGHFICVRTGADGGSAPIPDGLRAILERIARQPSQG